LLAGPGKRIIVQSRGREKQVLKNVIIMGSGRSGTSMVAGTLAGAGYFMGERMIPAGEQNEKGFFEDFEINAINEQLIESAMPFWRRRIPYRYRRWIAPDDQPRDHRWLASIPVHRTVAEPDPAVRARMNELTSRSPYCFKDPRFSYTLPAWRKSLANEVYICVFRDPDATAQSMVKMCSGHPYWRDVHLPRKQALRVWESMYAHILERHSHEGRWLFLHFNQVLTPEGLEKIEQFAEVEVDRGFPDSKLRHARSVGPVPDFLCPLYFRLCALAGYDQSGPG
jgi:hypothetical protein